MNLIVSFDIKFKTNKENLLKILNHYGFNKIQDCLYFADVDNSHLIEIQDLIMENMKETDSIIIMPLCKSCYEKLNVFGRNLQFEDEFYKIL